MWPSSLHSGGKARKCHFCFLRGFNNHIQCPSWSPTLSPSPEVISCFSLFSELRCFKMLNDTGFPKINYLSELCYFVMLGWIQLGSFLFSWFLCI